jgi:cell wall-associated NlpC family hydrolase
VRALAKIRRTSLMTRSTARLFSRRSLAAVAVGAGLVVTPVAGVATAAPAAAAETAAYPAAPTAASQKAVDTAMAQRGKPYQYGAEGPDSYDCSGLTQYSWNAAGVALPRTTSQQAQTGTPVDRSALQPGDLVFFYDPISHVGIYIGNNEVVHAPTEGDVVKVSNIDAIGSYNTARRVG